MSPQIPGALLLTFDSGMVCAINKTKVQMPRRSDKRGCLTTTTLHGIRSWNSESVGSFGRRRLLFLFFFFSFDKFQAPCQNIYDQRQENQMFSFESVLCLRLGCSDHFSLLFSFFFPPFHFCNVFLSSCIFSTCFAGFLTCL